MEPGRPLWERQPDEPIEAYLKFTLWLEKPHPDPDPALSRLWCWRLRAAAYRQHLDALRMEAARAATADFGARTAVALDRALSLAEESIEAALETNTKLQPHQIAPLLKTVVELHRLLSGEATSRVALDTSGLSDDELARLHATLAALVPE